MIHPVRFMTIGVVGAIGVGGTDKSAFDQALWKCGLHDFNLLPLSSVIPQYAGRVVNHGQQEGQADWDQRAAGDLLYCVMASKAITPPPGHLQASVAAGVGWARHPDGRGVFVEHTVVEPGDAVISGPRAIVLIDSQITVSLHEMATRRGWALDQVVMDRLVVVGQTRGAYVCALVVAAIEASGWECWPAPEGA